MQPTITRSAITSAPKKKKHSKSLLIITTTSSVNVLQHFRTYKYHHDGNCQKLYRTVILDILRQNIFPDRPEEAAMFGCKSLST